MSKRPQSMSAENTVTSSGHELSTSKWLDNHFNAARAEYEAMLHAVEIKSGDRVLDAGCGSGSFLPLISKQVGESGHISAFDLASENVDLVRQRVENNEFLCTVDVRQGELLTLPYEDNSFDVIWCANVIQYLEISDFSKASAEFYRVLRPNGVLAIKEIDFTALQFGPLPPQLFWNYVLSVSLDSTRINCGRTLSFPEWLRNDGFSIVSYKTYLSEDHHPLNESQLALLQGILASWANHAIAAPDISEQEKKLWQTEVANFDSPKNIMNNPNFYFRRPYALIIARLSELGNE